MQPYRQQPRRMHNRDKMRFPSQATIQVELFPLQPFGMDNSGGTEVLVESADSEGACRMIHDEYNGRVLFQAVSDPKPLQMDAPSEHDFQVSGNVVSLSFACKNYQQLLEALRLCVGQLPSLMSTRMLTPVAVNRVGGFVGDVPFAWTSEHGRAQFNLITPDIQIERIGWSAGMLRGIAWQERPALAAALHHFHVAYRLMHVGPSPWEFLPEAILNLSKVLEALCGQDRDEVRCWLSSLGVSDARVELRFMSIMRLRNDFGVGHVMLSQQFKDEQIIALSTLVMVTLSDYRALLTSVLEKAANGETCYNERRTKRDAKKQRLLSELVQDFTEWD